jgi:uncharacterized protein (TIGR03790 family)
MEAGTTLMKNPVLLVNCVFGLLSAVFAHGAGPGDEVVVVYNKNLLESKSVADYYAQRRLVPKGQLFGLDLPNSETMTRGEFEHRLAEPLLRKLRDNKLLVFKANGHHSSQDKATNELPVEAKIRYAALCYGVPLKILNDPSLTEEGMDKIRPELRRNDAAVDSELALLPTVSPKPLIFGALANRFYGVTNSALLSPTNGLLLVARLDGPTPEIARGLVDKAMEAETNGLWGRAYFDARGITNGSYKIGDDWIRGAAELTTRLGFETVLDNEPATFPASFPMSHIAIYAGWYDGGASGPFTRPKVEFMPGAFAYHLHSFSAQTIRSVTANWVGPLLAKGATATMGCVEEPYLEGTPDIRSFLVRFLYFGFSFGEAASACQSSLSWQTTVVGDPLYRPCAKQALEQHLELIRRKSNLLEWSHLRVVNMNLATGLPAEKLIGYLETTPETAGSAVLLEKLADLYFQKAKFPEAALNYRKALEQSPSPQQHIRLLLALARSLDSAGKEEDVFGIYQEFVIAFPDYPDLLSIYRKLAPLAEKNGRPKEKEKFEREIERLSPSPSATKP